MGRFGLTEIIVVTIIGFLIYSILKSVTNKNKEKQQELPKNIVKEEREEVILNIPEICPHCKNPNSKKIRLCEWCGNQII